ncbi:hemolysin III family protein [Bradyrhizobium sp. STM 3562]|uniref:PAQR family membrane homeostasis protein TrhA n=1 Tax=Bradyrhizobium sp. STM 3562 TaxID=578924 RepID=UPI00388FBA18
MSSDFTAPGRRHIAAEPGAIDWDYDPLEVIADGIVHLTGVCLGLIAGPMLIVLSLVSATLLSIIAVVIYVWGLLSMLSFSAAFNLWPVSRTKWLLRRFDHSAIFLLIAATYTPFIVDLKNSSLAGLFLIGLWSAAVLGIMIKLLCPGRFERTSIGFCLLMGWSGILLYEGAKGLFPPGELRLVIIGGALYTFGLVFHLWQQLRFQNAIWHFFVLLGAACHYVAVLELVLQ